MINKKKSYENTANTLIKQFERRGMEAFYCEDKEAARAKILEMIPEGSTVGWGGSETLIECGITESLKEGNYETYDKSKIPAAERTEIYQKMIAADFFLMSTNAFTLDGQLVNIDGRGDRLAFLLTGPKEVIVVTGMNKLTKTVQEAYDRVRTHATPPNTVRLGIKTPCQVNGVCSDCMGGICSQIVVTRTSMTKGRIKVIMVGEELGY